MRTVNIGSADSGSLASIDLCHDREADDLGARLEGAEDAGVAQPARLYHFQAKHVLAKAGVVSGSREKNASNQRDKASDLIRSGRKMG